MLNEQGEERRKEYHKLFERSRKRSKRATPAELAKPAKAPVVEPNPATIERYYGTFLSALGYDWRNDPNMKDTPKRVTKMFLEEITKGVYTDSPKVTAFDNVENYTGIVFSGNISVKSLCSHHMMPFFGKAHIAYIPVSNGKVIGLSKLNRIVDHFSRRPQLQENLTTQIHDFINNITVSNKGVAVMIECDHMCVSMRGVQDDSTMMTTKLSGVFLDNENRARDEFYSYINKLKK